MGIRTVAVFSDADRRSPHVLAADDAVHIGPSPSAESYLRVDRLLEAAKATGAQAIHPGYGFLAERAHFAKAVIDAGLTWIGPAPETVAAMGDKTEARRRMQAAEVPIVPGVVDAVVDADEAARVAQEIGFPILLKASAGGGGKGMRVVETVEEIPKAFESAGREAVAAFGDGSLYVEKYLDAPRHIEIQILGDSHGKILYLGERECSIQRRHQKLVEECPSPVVTPELRTEMGEAAVRAAKAVDYLGAGTVEFLFHQEAYYFLEMNTRLQVEHPVTELVTGLDLVELQIRVAGGEPLGLEQEEISLQGHAIECRITSENPYRGFLPSTGVIDYMRLPAGPGVRWDGGIMEGFEVGLHYDPLLAKLIVHATSREAAIHRMSRALEELVIGGIDTCTPFHRRVMEEPDFLRGAINIRYVEDHPDLMDDGLCAEEIEAAALAAALLEEEDRRRHRAPRLAGTEGGREISPWRRSGWPWPERE